MSMTPYEIRLELLKMAKDLVSEDFYARREEASTNWHDSQSENKDGSNTRLVLPSYPSVNEIINKAGVLNEFISADTKTSRITL